MAEASPFIIDVDNEGKDIFRLTDSLMPYRWSPKFCVQYLQNRPWDTVSYFYSSMISGRLSLPEFEMPDWQSPASDSLSTFLQTNPTPISPAISNLEAPNKKRGSRASVKWNRSTFRIDVAYYGPEFDGWQSQPGLHTVQGVIQKALEPFIERRSGENKPGGGGQLAVAGRTDKGVHALGQVCSFYTWKEDVSTQEIQSAINSINPNVLRAFNVDKVSRSFHSNFSARWRRYIYILPLHESEGGACKESQVDPWRKPIQSESLAANTERICPAGVDIASVDAMLQALQGRDLNFSVFARDTKKEKKSDASMVCFLYRACAKCIWLPRIRGGADEGTSHLQKAMLVDLIGKRFLRRMVRILVSTTVREAAAGADSFALFRLMETNDRRSTAPPAPPDGLCLANVGY